jgi:membrane-bound serine protease (ClpP class)
MGRYKDDKERAIMKKITFLIFLLTLLTFITSSSSLEKHINVMVVDGVINPIISEFIIAGIKKSENEGAECLIIQLDTPGGLDLSMRSIIKKMMSSSIPIVVYVSPSGARAASAGTFITLASNIAAMAPGTNIGAAHPVSMGGGKMDKEMIRKVENDAAAYIESIAKKRGRNQKWAIKAVRESISITAGEALKLGVIDIVADDLNSLIKYLNGKIVNIDGEEKEIITKGVKITYIDMNLRDKILKIISDPNIAYILMMLGFYGLFFELSNPGAIFPGVIGGICLILAFYAFQALPVNYAGIILIILAIILFIAEIKIVSHGILALGGIISMTLGSLMLFESSAPYLRISVPVVITTVILTSSLFILAIYLVIKAYRSKPVIGSEGLVGEIGIAKSRIAPEGKVFIFGELWNAYSVDIIEKEEKVRVVEVNNLKLKVKKEV